MYCTRKVTNDVVWIGASDRRLQLFESVYPVPKGVSYNSYLVNDDKTVLLDTVDKAVAEAFFENLEHELDGRPLNYVIVNHMEPDHAATLYRLTRRYPEVAVLCSARAKPMMEQFFPDLDIGRVQVVSEEDTLCSGRHRFRFVMAPMVHWPEVMVTYDETDKILFSADAFGTFGALNGKLFADEADFDGEYLSEARRYYTNIVGKYGVQVQALLKKASALDIRCICPLHGFVWRRDLEKILRKYDLWSTYTPEEKGVLICYTSVYGNTERAAEILASELTQRGVATEMADASFVHSSNIVASAFRYSHIVFATTTYNMNVFVTMENLLNDLVAHNLQNRTAAVIGNGTWAPVAAKLTADKLAAMKNVSLLSQLTVKSSLDKTGLVEVVFLAETLANSVNG